MQDMLSPTIAALFSLAFAQLDQIPNTRLDPELRCLLGVYALPEGKAITITGADGRPRGLQYTLSDGHFGTLTEESKGTFSAGPLKIAFGTCTSGKIQVAQASGARLQLIEKETVFAVDGGVKLRGKLVLPAKGRAEAIAIWIEGSNNDPSTDDTIWQYELARRGIGVFVYDKRGTGTSEGAPSSDFHLRARDTVAAVNEARRLAPQTKRFGVIGGSQGGWVAPLTATLTPIKFVIAAFAMAEGPIAQDKELVEQQLRQAGFDAAVLADAAKLTAITERIVRSNLADGFADLEAFKTKFAGAPWLKAIQPRSYTGLFLLFSSDDIRSKGPAMAQGLTFDFEPRPVIESIDARQLWLLAGSDGQAPNAATQTILKQIQQKRKDLEVVVFPKADHGLIERDGSGLMRYSERLFDIAADWILRKK
jgi:hypothetical protein